MLTYSEEEKLWNEGYEVVCGVDEAGRGPLCGPVAAAACASFWQSPACRDTRIS